MQLFFKSVLASLECKKNMVPWKPFLDNIEDFYGFKTVIEDNSGLQYSRNAQINLQNEYHIYTYSCLKKYIAYSWSRIWIRIT